MKKCDIVMKGGTTSGVVYPRLVTKLSKEYEFVRIGGNSAGSIAAVMTAAAEYQRQVKGGTAGFDFIEKLPDDIEKNMIHRFQAHPAHSKLFKAFLKFQQRSDGEKPIAWHETVFRIAKWPATLFKPSWKQKFRSSPHIFYFLATNFRSISKAIETMPDTHYGVCPGTTQPASSKLEGLTDWINTLIETSAGRLDENGGLPEVPFTFRHLRKAEITLNTITTNVSQHVPHRLPDIGTAYIDPVDAKQLFPANICKYIQDHTDNYVTNGSKAHEIAKSKGYWIIPSNDDMPILLASRLSFSVPPLLSAVPLYRAKFFKPDKNSQKWETKLIKCWFSDGGIASNFPIHLFDDLLPKRPTFGISLGEFDADVNDPDENDIPGQNRVYLPMKANQGGQLPNSNIENMFSFAASLLDSGLSWQDKMQSGLPGYKERIARIYLKSDDEGGFNLQMKPKTIRNLMKVGGEAGAEILENFDFDAHRWRRLLSSYAALEELMERITEGMGDPSDSQSMEAFLKDYETKLNNGELGNDNYKPSKEEFGKLIEQLKIIKSASQNLASTSKLRDSWSGGGMPKPAAKLETIPARFQS